MEFNSATKSKETRNKILEREVSHARMFSHPKILFLVSLLFVALLNSIPTYLLNFEYFIILYSDWIWEKPPSTHTFNSILLHKKIATLNTYPCTVPLLVTVQC